MENIKSLADGNAFIQESTIKCLHISDAKILNIREEKMPEGGQVSMCPSFSRATC